MSTDPNGDPPVRIRQGPGPLFRRGAARPGRCRGPGDWRQLRRRRRQRDRWWCWHGKTHLSIALACCQHDYRVRFVVAAELVTLLVEVQQQDGWPGFDVAILMISAACRSTRPVPTCCPASSASATQAAASWRREIPPSAPVRGASRSDGRRAVIDRIVHHATVLTTAGDSYRLKAATRNHASRLPQEVPRQLRSSGSRRTERSDGRPRRDDHHNSTMGLLFKWPKGPFLLAIPRC